MARLGALLATALIIVLVACGGEADQREEPPSTGLDFDTSGLPDQNFGLTLSEYQSCESAPENLPTAPPASESQVAGRLGLPRHLHTSALLHDGKVLAIGGRASTGITASVEVFDPATEVWVLTGEMTTPRVHHTATVLGNGHVLVVGGQSSIYECPLRTSEIYDPAQGVWNATGELLPTRRSHAAVLLKDGRVLVTGGQSKVFGGGSGQYLDL